MTLRHCNACSEWHDLAEPWPEACAGHHRIARREPVDPEKRSTIFDNVSVTRGHWREDRVTKEMIPVSEWQAKYGTGPSITIIKDIEPYQAVTGRMVEGKLVRDVIGGRKQHRDHLRGTGTIEVGDQIPKAKVKETPGGLQQDIARAMQETGYWRP